MLPPAAFLDSGVLDWELDEHLLAGWVCVGHVSAVAEPGAYVAREIGGRQRSSSSAARTAPRAPSTTSAATAAPASSRRPRARSAAASSARTTPGPTTSRATSAPPRTWTGSRTSTRPATGWSRSASRSLGGLVLIDLSGEAPARRRTTSASSLPHLDHYSTRPSPAPGSSSYEVAANWKGIAENYNECLHCPGVHPELNALSDYMSGEGLYGAGAWCGGSMALQRGRRDDGQGGRPRSSRPPIAALGRGRPAQHPLLRALPQRADLAPSRLRDAAHALAARARPHRRRLRVLLRARDDRATRLRPRRRDQLLGPDQPPGLARLRTDPEGGSRDGLHRQAATRPRRDDVHAFDAMVAARYMPKACAEVVA